MADSIRRMVEILDHVHVPIRLSLPVSKYTSNQS
jgi:hypothetical protein